MEEKDYKKLYEDVVALAKDGLKDGLYLSQSAKAVTEFLFPQLKETEDEKVRKELTRFLIDFNNGYYSRPSETKIDSWIKWIDEKCEQKPTDKVESKFKVGDWIVQENVGIYQVIEICESWYEVIDVKDNHYSISFDKEYMCHLWTIQDAKDGDVLYSPCCKLLWIYKDEKTCHIGSNLNYTPCSIVGNTHICIPNDAQPATKEQRDLLFQNMKEAGYECDAEKKELKKIVQNHTGEIKPKFNVGDWVVYNRDDSSREIIQVYDIKDGRYYFTDNIHFSWSINECDEKSHLWTIEDAKDGDVLAAHECLVLFKEIDGLNIRCYCTYHYLNSESFYIDTLQNKIAFQPATKEQCDLLFQKMKEAGYEWDAEKKELNKIEKQGEKTEPIEGFNTEFERQISHLIASTINKEYNYTKDFVKWTSDALLNYAKHELEKQGMQKVINEYNEHEPTSYEIEKWNEAYEKGYDIGYMNGKNEQKQVEWSFPYNVNETIDKLIAIAECLEMDGDCLFNGYTGTECGKFLRDLARKQVECESAEWSEEDEKKMNKIVSLCTNFKNGNTQLHSVYLEFQELIDWLKSIKDRVQPQPKQEWSEDDEKMLLQIINEMEAIKSNSSTIFEKNIAQDKIDWLKSIRSRHITYELDAPLGYDKDMNPIYPPINHWRPSPEQMQAVFDASERNDKLGSVLRNLYDDLRKL